MFAPPGKMHQSKITNFTVLSLKRKLSVIPSYPIISQKFLRCSIVHVTTICSTISDDKVTFLLLIAKTTETRISFSCYHGFFDLFLNRYKQFLNPEIHLLCVCLWACKNMVHLPIVPLLKCTYPIL